MPYRNNIYRFLVWLPVALLFACSTDTPGLRMGDYTHMQTAALDTLVQGSLSGPAVYMIDLDQDNSPDLKLTCKKTIAGMTLQLLQPTLEISMLESPDTTFLYVDTNVTAPDETELFLYYKCYKTHPQEVFVSAGHYHYPAFLKENDEIPASAEWQHQETVPLVTQEVLETHDSIAGNITYHIYRIIRHECFDITPGSVGYLAFRMQTAEGIKSGWLLLGLIDNYKIYLVETAWEK